MVALAATADPANKGAPAATAGTVAMDKAGPVARTAGRVATVATAATAEKAVPPAKAAASPSPTRSTYQREVTHILLVEAPAASADRLVMAARAELAAKAEATEGLAAARV